MNITNNYKNIKFNNSKDNKKNEFKNTKEYMSYLLKEYPFITKYNVSISEKALTKAINNPSARYELERNIKAIGKTEPKFIDFYKKKGKKVLFISSHIEDIGEYPEGCNKTAISGTIMTTNNPKAKSPYTDSPFNKNIKNKDIKTEKINFSGNNIEDMLEKQKKKYLENKEIQEKIIDKNRKEVRYIQIIEENQVNFNFRA